VVQADTDCRLRASPLGPDHRTGLTDQRMSGAMVAELESLSLGCRGNAAALERLVAPGCHELGASGGEIGERTGANARSVPIRRLPLPTWHGHYPRPGSPSM
jgi:hypothetical protein